MDEAVCEHVDGARCLKHGDGRVLGICSLTCVEALKDNEALRIVSMYNFGKILGNVQVKTGLSMLNK